MTTHDKAQRATVQIGPLSVDGFQMPDGSYRMSQTQAAEAVGLSEQNAREFLQSKGFKALVGEGYTPAISDIEVEPDPGQRRGHQNCPALCMALMAETLERRFALAFGVERSESEQNALLAK